jgi:hypothetical protein
MATQWRLDILMSTNRRMSYPSLTQCFKHQLLVDIDTVTKTCPHKQDTWHGTQAF